VPYRKCPFNCPTCIANGRKRFDNLYKEDEKKYIDTLKKEAINYDGFVLTGDTDPTLNKNWLEDISKILYHYCNGGKIELQTRNYNLNNYDLTFIGVLSYSITNLSDYLKAWKFRKLSTGINRLVILLTKDFNILNVDTFNTMGFEQITFKVLHLSNDVETNEYIKTNRMEDYTNIYEIVKHYNGTNVSVRIDENCQDSENRYKIFRSNGKIYNNWEEE